MTWIPTVTPSQIEHWNLCERKWGFAALTKSYVQNLSAFRGDTGHAMLEAWGRDKTMPETAEAKFALDIALNFPRDLDQKRISAADYAARLVATVNKMTPLLEEYPHPWARSEKSFRVLIQDVAWSGRKDLETSETVIDFKFTSSTEFAYTTETLASNPQALTYAYEKFKREALDQVKVRFHYGLVSYKPRAWIAERIFTPEAVAEAIKPYNEIAREILQVRAKHPDPLSLAPNWLACPRMGGCPFQDKCKPTPEQIIEANVAMGLGQPAPKPKKEEKKMGLLLSNISSNTAAIPAATTPQAAAVPAATGIPLANVAPALAEVLKKSTSLLRLGIARPEVVKHMTREFGGLHPELIEATVPREVAPAQAPTPAVNPGPPPDTGAVAASKKLVDEQGKAETPAAVVQAEEKAKAGRKSKASVGTTAAATIDTANAGALEELIQSIAQQVKDASLGSGVDTDQLEHRANACLALAQAFRALRVP